MDKTKIRLWCIHGNLQLPTVWTPLTTGIKEHFGDQVQVTCENIWETPADNCQQWAEQFCHRVIPFTAQSQQILLGYSLGGRLALHALLHRPELWTKAVIIAAEPRTGTTEQEKTEPQFQTSPSWGERFLTTPWEQFLADWDALPVFGGRANLTERPEALFPKSAVYHAFQAYDKRKQVHLIPKLKTLKHPPILYVTGQEDRKYKTIGHQLATDCGVIQHVTIANAAHRVPWENPSAFLRLVTQVCEQTTQQIESRPII